VYWVPIALAWLQFRNMVLAMSSRLLLFMSFNIMTKRSLVRHHISQTRPQPGMF
jgi:hypothetical protein